MMNLRPLPRGSSGPISGRSRRHYTDWTPLLRTGGNCFPEDIDPRKARGLPQRAGSADGSRLQARGFAPARGSIPQVRRLRTGASGPGPRRQAICPPRAARLPALRRQTRPSASTRAGKSGGQRTFCVTGARLRLQVVEPNRAPPSSRNSNPSTPASLHRQQATPSSTRAILGARRSGRCKRRSPCRRRVNSFLCGTFVESHTVCATSGPRQGPHRGRTATNAHTLCVAGGRTGTTHRPSDSACGKP